jgi:Domain of unknown function (DUF4476)
MQRTILIALLLVGALRSLAQPAHFVYVQAEPAQAFLVTYKTNTFRSSASGYLIMPNLTDSLLQLVVSFPDKRYPDQSFVVNTLGNDQGYLLKEYADRGWGLLDWNKLEVTYAQRPATANNHAVTASDQGDFATLLAKAAGDNSLLAASPAPISSAGEVKSSAPAIATTEPKIDTIKASNGVVSEVKTPADPKPMSPEKAATEPKPLNVPLPSYCKSILTEAEFSDGVSKLQLARSETSKVNLLREYIGDRCYLTDQVKRLALLLTTDDVKYDFLLESWTKTADRSGYLSLTSVFSSSTTADRFKEMFQ